MKRAVRLLWPWSLAAASLAALPPAPSAGAAAAVPGDPLEGCLEVPRALCLQGAHGGFVVGPAHAPGDLAIWYQFDKSLPVDESGRGHHLADPERTLTPLPVGPGVLGRGGSAAFDGRLHRAVHDASALEGPSFSVMLWIYLREDSVGTWRTIFKKGAGAEELLPALLLWPDERRLQLRASPRADTAATVLNSVGLLPLRRWTHIAATGTAGGAMRLYINGVKDGEIIVDSPRVVGGGELYLGRDPWRAGVKAYLDDFRWYTRAVAADEIRAVLYPSLTGVAGDFVRLGCASCTFTEAVRSCTGRSHLCSLQELFSGGFHTARAMGWLAASPEVWYDSEEGTQRFSGAGRMGLCCAD